MSRKQIFANLNNLAAEQDERPDLTEQQVKRPAPVRPLLGSSTALAGGPSAVGVLGKSLSELNDRSKRAEAIEQQLMSGETIVKLDPGTIEPSFIPDRMAGNDPDFDSLVASMRENGQEVPILVRPHPDKPKKYQTAYGWRRTQAASVLGIEVDAIVRQLTDEQLIKAQGQENNERKNLSYIEKARWAHRLAQRFPRDFVMSTLSIHKSDLSNMLSVVEKIPEDLVEAIGPAEEAGRRQWMTLAERFSGPGEAQTAASITTMENFARMTSAERLQCVLNALKPLAGESDKDLLLSSSGKELGQITKSKRRVTITIDRKVSPDFADYIANQLPRLAKEYRQRSEAAE